MDLVQSLLPMKADLYRQFDSQDSNTGAILKEWHYYDTVSCYAKSIISNSASARGSNKQIIDTTYQNDKVLEVRTEKVLSVREKITNIRDKNNTPIWTELNYPTETPTVFEVIGSSPVTDPFGMVIGYSSTIKRSENQQIGF